MRISIVVVGAIATSMALTVHSIYGLWYLSSDLVFVILFPQLVCVVHFKEHTNTYGSLCAYFMGLFLRAAGGEPVLGLPVLIEYPFYDAARGGQLFPFRTFAMLMSACTIVGVSRLTIHLFETGKLAPKWDWFNCVVNIPDDHLAVEPHEELSILGTPGCAGSVAKTYQANEMNGRVNPGLDHQQSDGDDEGEGGVLVGAGTPRKSIGGGEKTKRTRSDATPPKSITDSPGGQSGSIKALATERAREVAAAGVRAAGRGSIKLVNTITRRPSEVAYVATQL